MKNATTLAGDTAEIPIVTRPVNRGTRPFGGIGGTGCDRD